MSSDHTVKSVAELRELYREPSKLVVAKKVDRIDERTSRFISMSPFCLLATADATGKCDVSPKGGPPGFVRVLGTGQVAVPDLNGNNLIDSLINVVDNGHAALLLLIPGSGETLRIDGAAIVTTDPAVLDLWTDELRRPKCAVVIDVDAAFIHCAKAFLRGGIWDPASWERFGDAPDGCDLLAEHLGLNEQGEQALRVGLKDGYADDLAADLPE
jgi:uncharacterized protein